MNKFLISGGLIRENRSTCFWGLNTKQTKRFRNKNKPTLQHPKQQTPTLFGAGNEPVSPFSVVYLQQVNPIAYNNKKK